MTKSNRSILLVWAMFILIASASSAQEGFDDRISYIENEPVLFDSTYTWLDSVIFRTNLPAVNIKTNNFFLQKSFYPDYYKSEYDVRKDIRKVKRADSSMIMLWDSLGTKIMGIIETLSGINWVERDINIHLLRYTPTEFMYDPLLIPVEGIKRQSYIEASASGLHRFFNLIRAMAGRNIMQLNHIQYNNPAIAGHPLLGQSQYRFDIMSLTLAMAAAEFVIPQDSMALIIDSEPFQIHNPGWELYRKHFKHSWKLHPETPLLFYLTRENHNSPLIELTRAPRIRKPKTNTGSDYERIKLLAGGGRLGFSVLKTSKGYLEIIDIDTLGLAYANGLMIGDQIKRVNGEYPRTARELMGKILKSVDSDGVYMLLLRDGDEIGLMVMPVEEVSDEDVILDEDIFYQQQIEGN